MERTIGQHGEVAARKPPVEQAMDLFVYAPLGFVLEAPELLPKLIERGRRQVAMARVLGRFAVEKGEVRAGKQLSKLQEQAAATLAGLGLAFAQPDQRSSTTTAPGSAASSATAEDLAWAAVEASPPTTDGAVPEIVVVAPADPSALAIPDYDSLAASQVIPRLGGLSTGELEAVRAYEAAGRGRKTILNKIAQLQAG